MILSNSSSLVSVVIPSFNHSQYIEAALQSVANQTYKNIELILVDDASRDETVPYAAKWLSNRAERFYQPRILRNKINSGADRTINRGINEANGEFVAILNSDDLFSPTRIEELLTALIDNGRDVAFSKVFPINDYGSTIPANHLPVVLRGVFDEADRSAANYPSISFGFLEKNIAISTGNLLIRRSIFEKIGKFRPLKYVHDWDFILRSIIISEPVYVPNELYAYRIHDSNSFSGLADVANIETQVALQNFRNLASTSIIENKLAPLSTNWPQLVD